MIHPQRAIIEAYVRDTSVGIGVQAPSGNWLPVTIESVFSNPNQTYRIEPSKAEMVWECNECGSQEYTMAISEDDVQSLGCGRCGGDEWHKAEAR